jgi:hypothetical protein
MSKENIKTKAISYQVVLKENPGLVDTDVHFDTT